MLEAVLNVSVSFWELMNKWKERRVTTHTPTLQPPLRTLLSRPLITCCLKLTDVSFGSNPPAYLQDQQEARPHPRSVLHLSLQFIPNRRPLSQHVRLDEPDPPTGQPPSLSGALVEPFCGGSGRSVRVSGPDGLNSFTHQQ